jgi:membrane fusion protein, multidrug efflux system
MAKTITNIGVSILIILFGGALTAGIIILRRAPSVAQSTAEKVTNVEVLKLVVTTINDTFTVTGSLEPWKEVLLSSEAKGKIEWLGIEEGDKVNEGDVLLKVDRASAEIRYKQAQIELAMASLELDRLAKLLEKGIGSTQSYDQAKVDRDMAQADLNTKKMELDYATVIAPFNGFVDIIEQREDEFVNVGTPLISLIQISKLKMVVGIADQDIPFFAIGDPVSVEVDAYKDRQFTGTIHRIGQRADSTTHTFETEIELDNWAGLLKPGMIARAVLIRESYPNSIAIPIFSILTDGSEKYVFVEQDGKAVETPISVLLHQGNLALIEKGLQAGDRLIVAGHRNLRDGAAVNVRGIQP